jgi:predicted ATPase
VAGRFADGVWLAELAPARDPEQVSSAVAAALGVRDQPGVPAAQALARVLARQQLEQLRKTPRGNDTASFLATMEPLPPRT